MKLKNKKHNNDLALFNKGNQLVHLNYSNSVTEL